MNTTPPTIPRGRHLSRVRAVARRREPRARWLHLQRQLRFGRRLRSESGQASVEYALVLLGAALVATLLIGWATKTELLGDLFDHVLSLIRGKAQ
jgi:Flp pilus assembly pilin Flp